MANKKDEITIRSSAAEYLTYVASVGDQQDSIEMRYEDEKNDHYTKTAVMVNDMYAESSNDDWNYNTVATQADFDVF